MIQSFRLFFAGHGCVEVGLAPAEEEGFDFCVLTTIMVGKTFITLNEEELANFFIFLRKKRGFTNIGIAEQYFTDVSDEFNGAFRLDKQRSGEFNIIFMDDEEGDFQSAGPVNQEDLKKILKNERKLNDVILNLKVMKRELKNDLDALAVECDGNADRIHDLNSGNSVLQLEMSTNHFHFFRNFINSLT